MNTLSVFVFCRGLTRLSLNFFCQEIENGGYNRSNIFKLSYQSKKLSIPNKLMQKTILALLIVGLSLANAQNSLTCQNGHNHVYKELTLSFQFACRDNVNLKTCLANVLWNDQIILSVVPTEFHVRTFKAQVLARVGLNRLQIEGAGDSTTYRLGIDNIKLVRQGSNQNIVINGGFQEPFTSHDWGIFTNAPGWSGSVQIGEGTIYNSRWKSQIASTSGLITQCFNFDSNFELNNGGSCPKNLIGDKSLTYILEFDYAARSKNVNYPTTSQAAIVWNNVVVAGLTPQDFLIRRASIQVQLKAGQNVLSFDGASFSDHIGLTIDNVKLTSAFDSNNLIVNGDFEDPQVGSGQWKIFQGGFNGWSGDRLEVGDCKTLYNGNWNANSRQCIELDSDANQRYSQTIDISPQQFAALASLAAQSH